ncbi:hypothetical protein TRFO_28546 [Tritrichomonas foetus]|uniref:TPR Domain containing protein n=1 Tax=Tritrichomonas foetus TaxID=1144522 RepID=A0A1J4K3H8_9EUKA|nr:hypothetical protein TRFO_28546 [Tritrichomonas foetus]|eukprot:OHT04045.1 hypothetical protein TRFO_28546 [Tritrichomonas foetus]
MSSRNQTRSDLSRSSQRKTISTAKMTQRDMDSSAHRLARIPNKFTVPKAAKIEQPESYAISYFNNNPDVQLDKRSPIEKLEEINQRLDGEELDDNDRFNFLVQRKSLSFLAYGENSPECFEALRDLGNFYNRQNRPESALRHLSKAQQITRSIEVSDEDSLSLAIELSEAHLSSKATTKAENNKQLNNAESALNPYIEIEVEDKTLAYKRDLLLARIKARRNKYDDALKLYEKSIDSLDVANDGRKNAGTAALYLEIGECAENANDMKTSNKMYKKAYDTFIELNMTDSAKLVEGKIPPSYLEEDYNYDQNYVQNTEEEEMVETRMLKTMTDSSLQSPHQSAIQTPKTPESENKSSSSSSSSSPNHSPRSRNNEQQENEENEN